MEGLTVRFLVLFGITITLSLALPYKRPVKWLGWSKINNGIIKMSKGFGSKFSVCPDMSKCRGDKVCCRTEENIKYMCCPENKPDCCNKDVLKEDTSESQLMPVIQTNENVGLECDGIPCDPNIFSTCCYSEMVHHWYCCMGPENKKLKNKENQRFKLKAKDGKFSKNHQMISNEVKNQDRFTNKGRYVRAGFDCDGITCDPKIFSTCCYSPVIHHGYCC